MRCVQLCGSLSILLHFLSLGLEWKLTFSSHVATAEFSKLTGILSAALSQHHLSGFETAQWNSITSISLFVVTFSKSHLTSHSKMSGSRLVITSSWLSGLWRSFDIIYSIKFVESCWDLFYGVACDVFWKMFYAHLKRMCILLFLDGISYNFWV